MTDEEANRLEIRTGTRAIPCSAPGLYCFAYEKDRKRIAIAAKGKAILTVAQAKALLKDLPDILEVFCGR